MWAAGTLTQRPAKGTYLIIIPKYLKQTVYQDPTSLPMDHKKAASDSYTPKLSNIVCVKVLLDLSLSLNKIT